MPLLILSQWSPTSRVVLHDGITIDSSYRAKLSGAMSSRMIDTITVDYPNEEVLNTWVIFHAFILDSPLSMTHYENQGYDAYCLEISDMSNSYTVDYDNILHTVYFNNKIEVNTVSYQDLYKRFLDNGLSYLNQVLNFYTDLGSSVYPNDRKMRDNRYWQLVIYFSIVDSIIESQSCCLHDVSCSNKAHSSSHYPIGQTQWLADKIFEIVKDENRCLEYMRIIEIVRKKIRNSTVHASLSPPVYPKFQFLPGHEVYDIERVVNEYGTDSTALNALSCSMREITRFLLLNRALGLNIFPALKPLQSITFTP